jgi:two-component system, NtrC family, sensor kinase
MAGMTKLFAGVAKLRLQQVLIIGFALTTAITMAVGTPITYGVIRRYLDNAQDSRVGRDMDLAEAFYNSKLHDLAASSERLASARTMRHNIAPAIGGDPAAVETIGEAVENELLNLPPTVRFILVLDTQGEVVAGRILFDSHLEQVATGSDWSDLPILADALAEGQPLAATEIVPVELLRHLKLDERAYIPLLDTPKAAEEPFDPRAGRAGLTLTSVAPVVEEGRVLGAVLVGHLFNNDFTLVDRIKAVAGVDTVTIFFGDLRVSTNVPLNEAGDRAIGTRVSKEVFDQVLLAGEEFTGEAFVVNQNYITRYEPLYDHRQEVVGILYVGAQQSSFQELLDSLRDQVFLIAGATVLLAVFIAFPVSWPISRPLSSLASATRQVSLGDWSVRVPIEGYYEMRSLAQSFNTMVETLKETQEQLLQKEKLASVGQLAAGVAHEINNPLGSVLLYADILRKETPCENLQQQEDLDMILREATRCKTIVNDLLNFSRQNQVLAQETDLNVLLRELAEETGKQHLFERIDIVTELDPALPTIQADPLQIRQVFLNLMSNAAEAMPGGGKLILRTCAGPESGMVTAEVEDNGVGISEENMRKLFTPFFTTKPIGKGTGLGLAIIYGIVKMHRGQIGVQSRVGKGTKFTLTLRQQLPVQNQQASNSQIIG